MQLLYGKPENILAPSAEHSASATDRNLGSIYM